MNYLNRILNAKYTLVVFLCLVAVWFCLWVFQIDLAPTSRFGGPDEGMRYLVPKFIFENLRLPTGYDEATIHSMGYWSYAFYPQFLGALVSVFFMAIASLFSSSPDMFLYAARLASVFFGVMAVLFIGKSTEKLLHASVNAKVFAYVAMILLATWPQVAFLSGYVNNDIVGLAGVSVLLYACIAGFQDGWNRRNSIILASGLAICLLGYSNSYGFVVFAVVFFLLTLWWQKQSAKKSLSLIGVVLLAVIVLAAPFFIRNVIVYSGDALGVMTFQKRTALWESDTGKVAQRSYVEQTGNGLGALLKDADYLRTQVDSTIARFGKMTVAPAEKYMNVYRYFTQIGVAGFVAMIVTLLVSELRRQKTRNAGRLLKQYKNQMLFIGGIFTAGIVTIALSVYYSLTVDYQAQGRYVIYLLIPLIIASLYGYRFLITEFIVAKYRLFIGVVLILLYLCTSLIIYYKYMFTTVTL